ncbi:MAG: hypothetical protein WKF57_19340 [Nakamurella sp.]
MTISTGTARAITSHTPRGRPPIGRRPSPALPRDLAASALVLGVASSAWFAWGSTGAPALRPWFLAGILAGLALAATALLLRRRLPGTGSHRGPRRAAVQRTYRRTLAAEIALIVAGNVVLNLTGRPEYVICWTYAVMSAHFLPLARLYEIRALRLTALAGIVIAIGGVGLGITTTGSPIAVTGGAGALALLVSGAVQLREARIAGAQIDG